MHTLTAPLTQASRQWATRPDDERFTSLLDMRDHFEALRANSRAGVVPSRQLRALAGDDSEHKSLLIQGPQGNAVAPTHYAFGQLAALAGAPAGYLRSLPAELAADNLNYGLHVQRDDAPVGVLLTRSGDTAALRAATGPNYGRVWNSDVTRALVDRFGDGVTGDFRVPGEFGQRVTVDKGNTTLYASDRDMFIFLADEDHRIELPNRRDGKTGTLARGFFVWNSEVGDATLGVAMFLFDYVCKNRMVWGPAEYRELRVRHTVTAPDRFVREVTPTLLEYSRSATAPIVAQLTAAQARKVGDLDAFLKARKFTSAQSEAIQKIHVAEEGRPMETLWDISTGITAYARGKVYQNERVDLERVAGKVLDMAA